MLWPLQHHHLQRTPSQHPIVANSAFQSPPPSAGWSPSVHPSDAGRFGSHQHQQQQPLLQHPLNNLHFQSPQQQLPYRAPSTAPYPAPQRNVTMPVSPYNLPPSNRNHLNGLSGAGGLFYPHHVDDDLSMAGIDPRLLPRLQLQTATPFMARERAATVNMNGLDLNPRRRQPRFPSSAYPQTPAQYNGVEPNVHIAAPMTHMLRSSPPMAAPRQVNHAQQQHRISPHSSNGERFSGEDQSPSKRGPAPSSSNAHLQVGARSIPMRINVPTTQSHQRQQRAASMAVLGRRTAARPLPEGGVEVEMPSPAFAAGNGSSTAGTSGSTWTSDGNWVPVTPGSAGAPWSGPKVTHGGQKPIEVEAHEPVAVEVEDHPTRITVASKSSGGNATRGRGRRRRA